MPILKKCNGQKVIEGLALSQVNEMFLDCGETLAVNVQLVDKRHISDKQRKFIFALCNDMEFYTGNDSEYMRLLVQQYKQAYSMALKRICMICGQRADIHHVDHIGAGNNRNKISHVGKRALPLCRCHHGECHDTGEDKFIELYHLTPFVIDKKMEYFIKKRKLKCYDGD